MEGLLIDEVLRALAPELPSRRLSWRFPDPYTCVLPLARGSLWLFNRPPNPRIAYRSDTPSSEGSRSGFQDALVARAAGPLQAVEQMKLDRVVRLSFGEGVGFVTTPAVTLVAELTGRNCNLILLDEQETVLAAAREIRQDVNRYRQVVVGRPYLPPPPYDKLDPRRAEEAELRAALLGKPLKRIRSLVDGVGPDLGRTLAILAGVADDRPLEGEALAAVLAALKRVVAAPSAAMNEALDLPDVETLRRRERRRALQERLRAALDRELGLVDKRLADAERTLGGAERAPELRRRGDVLMAHAHEVPPGAERVRLDDFEGGILELTLDPAVDAVRNAQKLYERAKKREGRARRAEERLPELRQRRHELAAVRAEIDGATVDRLEVLVESYAPERRPQVRSGPGIRYRGPHGFTVVVGRNSRDNDTVTFKLARSRDLWLHVQGYRGSHVVVLAENREVPFDTVLFAARLAAAYSKAGQSDNVPVDYTLRKHVWKVKGSPPGAVNFTQHKTVYVTPDRHPEVDTEA